jgi:AbrB family looped-hinge helix DNA binding protein
MFNLLQIMESTTKTIGSKGEIVIPLKIREENNLKVNSKVQIISTKSGVLIIPLKKTFKELSQIFDKSKINNFKKIDDISFELMAGI